MYMNNKDKLEEIDVVEQTVVEQTSVEQTGVEQMVLNKQ